MIWFGGRARTRRCVSGSAARRKSVPVSRTPPERHQFTADLVCHQCANSAKQGRTRKYGAEEQPHVSVNGEYTYGTEPNSAELRKTPQIMNGVQGVAGSNPAVPTVRRDCPAWSYRTARGFLVAPREPDVSVRCVDSGTRHSSRTPLKSGPQGLLFGLLIATQNRFRVPPAT